MAKSATACHSMSPRAAVQPSRGGIAPGKAPMKVAMVVTRFSGVYNATYKKDVRSVRPPVMRLVSWVSQSVPATMASSPMVMPWARPIRPEAMGRFAVRNIFASSLRSIAWLSAADPAETTAIPIRASSSPGCTLLMPDRMQPR